MTAALCKIAVQLSLHVGRIEAAESVSKLRIVDASLHILGYG